MRSIYILICFFALIVINPAKAKHRDTTYKRGIYLVEVSGKTNIDIVPQGGHLKRKTSKGDTIFGDEKYVVLGDDTNIRVYGIFKRFHLKQKFSSYSVPVYKGKLAKPDFKTNTAAYLFRTQIRNQCKNEGVNFAGHYTIVEWGCGSDCQEIAIVDRVDGKIYYSNEPGFDMSYGFQSRPDSRMLILNSGLLREHKGYVACSNIMEVETFEWAHNKARKLP